MMSSKNKEISGHVWVDAAFLHLLLKTQHFSGRGVFVFMFYVLVICWCSLCVLSWWGPSHNHNPIPQVVQRIKAIEQETRLLVVDQETYESLRNLRLTATEEMAILGTGPRSSPVPSPSPSPSSASSSPNKRRENGLGSKQQVQKPNRSHSKAAKKVGWSATEWWRKYLILIFDLLMEDEVSQTQHWYKHVSEQMTDHSLNRRFFQSQIRLGTMSCQSLSCSRDFHAHAVVVCLGMCLLQDRHGRLEACQMWLVALKVKGWQKERPECNS